MLAFRFLLLLILTSLVGYTAVVIANHGIGLLPVFFGDIGKMGWPGQFNLDFSFMLTLSALWVAWRHQFSLPGLLLAGLAAIGGSLFLSTYLLVLSWQVKGNINQLLLGSNRTK
jgi:hypothetical protein